MAIGSTGYETFAWWLARENIGQSFRQRYAVAKELPPSSTTPFSKLDVLKVISCYAHVGNASDAGEMQIITKRGLKGVRAPGAMRGFQAPNQIPSRNKEGRHSAALSFKEVKHRRCRTVQ